jgi:hypothetical protein
MAERRSCSTPNTSRGGSLARRRESSVAAFGVGRAGGSIKHRNVLTVHMRGSAEYYVGEAPEGGDPEEELKRAVLMFNSGVKIPHHGKSARNHSHRNFRLESWGNTTTILDSRFYGSPVLILLKGVLFARSSRLIPDKANLGFRFPSVGPGRGGTYEHQCLLRDSIRFAFLTLHLYVCLYVRLLFGALTRTISDVCYVCY